MSLKTLKPRYRTIWSGLLYFRTNEMATPLSQLNYLTATHPLGLFRFAGRRFHRGITGLANVDVHST